MSAKEALKALPALGRPFKLGMLYDCTNDKLIQGQALWDDDALKTAQQDKPSIDAMFPVVLDDSIASKCSYLAADNNLKLSLMAGLVNVSGSAKYFSDRKSSRQLVRVTLQCKITSNIQQLDMQQLGPVQNQSVISATRATHVVAHVLYGLEAFLVFDRCYSVEEDLASIQDKMTNSIRFLSSVYESGSSDLAQIDQVEAANYKCKMYCDVALPTPPTTFKEALSILENHIFKLFRQGSSCPGLVPKKVWLYPTSKLDSSACTLVRQIEDDVVSQAEKLVEDLHEAEVWINDVIKANAQVCSTIQCFQDQQSRLGSLIKKFYNDLTRQLGTMIPQVRSCAMENNQLASFLKEVSDSPFSSKYLSSLLNSIEHEVRAVSLYLQSFSSIKCVSSDEMDSLGIDCDIIVSFEFRLGGTHTASLNKMETYLRTKTFTEDPSTKLTPWYKDSSKKRAIQIKAKLFKEFAQLNSGRKDITFVVCVSNEPPKSTVEGAAVVLYAEADPTDFDIPSKPEKVHVSKVTANEVNLIWKKPKHGSSNVLFYTIHYRPLNDSSEEWMTSMTDGAKELITVKYLVPDREYEFTVQAECKAGICPTSEEVKTKDRSKRSKISGSTKKPVSPHTTLAVAKSQRRTNAHSRAMHGNPPKKGAIEYPSALSSREGHDLYGKSHTQLQLQQSTTNPISLSQTSPIKLPLPPSTMFSPASVKNESTSMYDSSAKIISSVVKLVTVAADTGRSPEGNRQSDLESSSLNASSVSIGSPLQQQPHPDPSAVPVTPGEIGSGPAKVLPLQETPSQDKFLIQTQDQQSETPFGHMEKPQATNRTYKSIDLEWKKPASSRNTVQYYSVLYHVHGDLDGVYTERKTKGAEEHMTIHCLSPETAYAFKVQATFSSGVKLESEPSGAVYTKSHLAEKVRLKSKLISEKTNKNPAIFELSKKPIMVNRQKRVAKFEVGSPLCRVNEKVLMLVGARGAGKTTLINGIANYMYDVQWDDDFRFVLVVNEPSKKSQAHSQTSWITAYTLHRQEGSPIPYSLTIIDTPGFGDTEGIERDKKIADQIKDFFSIRPPKGIDILHGIGFVAQASLARLSQSQKYIFDLILSIYGRDVASNIFMMTTFADGQSPPVMDAIKEAKVPHQAFFKFNNSALFVTGESDSFDAMFWQMGVKSFKDFFRDFGKAEHKSLQLTREVLNERQQVENVLKELQPQIHSGLTRMDELQRVVILLQHNKALVEQNKDFCYSVIVTKQRKVNTPPGQYTTNCLHCNYTCHENCAFADNADKRRCCAMDRNGDCKVCPGHCIWSKHCNNPYIFELYEEEEVKTSDELKARFDTATEGESRAETMINNIKDELRTLESIVLEMVDDARKSLIRLDEIALRPNPLSEVDYIDQLIRSEEQGGRLGWADRVTSYKILRKRADLMRKIKDHNPKSGESLFSCLSEDGVSGSYNPATLEHLQNPTRWYHKFWKHLNL